MRRAEIMGLPPPRTGAAALTGAVDSLGLLINNANMRSRNRHSPHQLPHQSSDWVVVTSLVRQRRDTARRRPAPERPGSSPAAHPTVERDRPTVGVDVRLPVAVWRVAVDYTAGPRAAEPCLEPQRLPAEHASGGHHADQRVGVAGSQEATYLGIDRPDRVRLARQDETAELVAVAVLHQRAVLQHQHVRAPPQPRLGCVVARQLFEVMRLPSGPQPGVDARPTVGPVANCREHQYFVIAEEYGVVWAIVGVAQGADAERSAVNEIAQENRVPAVGRV